MREAMEFLAQAVVIGIGATAILDISAIARKKLLGTPAPAYGPVGRWLAYMPRGRFHHRPITASPPVEHETAIGWTAHYLTGIGFAAILLALFGIGWARHPTIVPALAVGIGSVAAPFLLMQPGMGSGIAASRTPSPRKARMRSLVTHGIFGVGLYAAGWAACLLDL